eukprot:g74561.t1
MRHRNPHKNYRVWLALDTDVAVYFSGYLIFFVIFRASDNMEAALAASRAGQHHVLTDFVARNEGKELRFYNKSLRDSGAYAVAKGLQVNTTVQTLNIGYNNLGDKGAALIAEAIKVNKTLTILSLMYNGIGETGTKAIGEALRENKESKLQTLDISVNYIGPQGAAAIANMLKVNKTVINIALASNEIGHAGAKAMGAALKVNNMLTSLELSHNNIGDAEGQEINVSKPSKRSPKRKKIVELQKKKNQRPSNLLVYNRRVYGRITNRADLLPPKDFRILINAQFYTNPAQFRSSTSGIRFAN